MTITEAYEEMRAHHRVLGEQLAARAEIVSSAVAAGLPYAAAVGGFIAYLTGEVLPHAAAEEKTIYPLAAAHAGLARMVEEMSAEHAALSSVGSRLAVLTDSGAAAGQARQIAELFAAHAAKENNVLLPVLLDDATVDLVALLGQIHHGAGHPRPDTLRPDTTR
jgi:iron-sulfur cluster repair protein YtfE (RIC family)